MKHVLLSLILLLSALQASAYKKEEVNINVNGQKRNMVVFSPSSLPAKSPLFIVTHGMIRAAYIEIHPEKRSTAKIDITLTEYVRFMQALLVHKYKALLYNLCCHRQMTS